MRILLTLILVLFSLYTGWIVWEFGYLSVFEVSFREHPSTQILFDLFISGFLILIVMIRDNQSRGRTFLQVLPYILMVIFAGSIGALLYFIVYPDLLKIKTAR